MTDLSDPIEVLAREAMTQPSDSAFYADDMFETHGFSGFSQTRDSSLREISNYDYVLEHFEVHYEKDDKWYVCHCSHWLVGWVDHLVVRILKNQEVGFVEDNITDIFKECIELLQALENYPVLDESKLSEMEYNATLTNMSYELPNWTSVGEEEKTEIFSWLWSQDVYPEGDDSDWFSELELGVACFALGFIDDNYAEELYDWLVAREDNEWLKGIALFYLAMFKTELYKDQGSLL